MFLTVDEARKITYEERHRLELDTMGGRVVKLALEQVLDSASEGKSNVTFTYESVEAYSSALKGYLQHRLNTLGYLIVSSTDSLTVDWEG